MPQLRRSRRVAHAHRSPPGAARDVACSDSFVRYLRDNDENAYQTFMQFKLEMKKRLTVIIIAVISHKQSSQRQDKLLESTGFSLLIRQNRFAQAGNILRFNMRPTLELQETPELLVKRLFQ